MLKTRRIEYVFESVRQKQAKILRMIDEGRVDPSTVISLSERADIELVDELRHQSFKYMNLSVLVGGNIGFFMYQGMKTTMHWYIALPLSFGAYFLSRNLILRNCMDRIYYSLEPIYLKLKGRDDE